MPKTKPLSDSDRIKIMKSKTRTTVTYKKGTVPTNLNEIKGLMDDLGVVEILSQSNHGDELGYNLQSTTIKIYHLLHDDGE